MYLQNYGFGSIFRRIFELASLCKGQKSSNITFRFSFKVFLTPLLIFLVLLKHSIEILSRWKRRDEGTKERWKDRKDEKWK